MTDHRSQTNLTSSHSRRSGASAMPVPASSRRLTQLGRANSRRVDHHSLMTNREHRGVQRVLMTADSAGEVWTYALDLAQGLSVQGVATILATTGDSLCSAQRTEASQIPGLTVCECDWQSESRPDCEGDMRCVSKWLLELEVIHAPDVIHLNDHAHAALPWRAPVLVVAHPHVLPEWQNIKDKRSTSEWQSYSQRVKTDLRAAQQVVTPTWAMADALETHYGQLESLRVIPNGRDHRRYHTLDAEEGKEAIILATDSMGDIITNVSGLQQIAPSLTWPVFVAGESPQTGSALSPFPENETVGEFVPLGLLTLEELANWYTRAAIYVLPARYEPFGLTALEAAFSGCALVLSDLPGLREIWGEAALYVASENRNALRETLQSLIDDAGLRAQMASRAFRHARRYRIETMTQAYMEVYAHLMAPSSVQHQARADLD